MLPFRPHPRSAGATSTSSSTRSLRSILCTPTPQHPFPSRIHARSRAILPLRAVGAPSPPSPPAMQPTGTSPEQPAGHAASTPSHADVIVVGAGPAGLAMAGALKHLHPDLTCIVLDGADRVGHTWHQHYDRLHLHSSKAVSYLPFLPFPEDDPRYPSKQQVADYLANYAKHFDLDVRLRHRVLAIRPATEQQQQQRQLQHEHGEGASTSHQSIEFLVTVSTGPSAQQRELRASNVVIATGQNSVPYEPELPGRSRFQGLVMHSAHYKNPQPFKGKKVLVVGFGNSAGEIALDLSEKGAHPTVLIRNDKVVIIPRGAFAPGFATMASMDYKRTLRPWKPLLEIVYGPLCTMGVPNMRPYGVPQVVPWWGGNPGVWDPTPPLIDIGQCAGIVKGDIKVLRGSLEGFTESGVLVAPMVPGPRGSRVPDRYAQQEETFDAVILCTGYRECFSQLLPPELAGQVMDASRTAPAVSGDTTAVPGLYFIGFDNLLSLLAMIRQEAEYLAGVIAARARAAAAAGGVQRQGSEGGKQGAL